MLLPHLLPCPTQPEHGRLKTDYNPFPVSLRTAAPGGDFPGELRSWRETWSDLVCRGQIFYPQQQMAPPTRIHSPTEGPALTLPKASGTFSPLSFLLQPEVAQEDAANPSSSQTAPTHHVLPTPCSCPWAPRCFKGTFKNPAWVMPQSP